MVSQNGDYQVRNEPSNPQFCEYSLKFFVQVEVVTFMHDTTIFHYKKTACGK